MTAGASPAVEGEPGGRRRLARQPPSRSCCPASSTCTCTAAAAPTSMEGGDAAAIDTIARTHARHGTTALLATTMTAPHGRDRGRAARARAGVPRSAPRGAARVLGVHLEGPYINPGKLGAQPDFARRAVGCGDPARLHALAPIRVITLAPEMPGTSRRSPRWSPPASACRSATARPATKTACAALARGARGFTHLFNAMSGLHHRAPGMVGRGAGACAIRRADPRPAARASRRDPRGAARDPAASTA